MRIAFITYEYPSDTGKGGIGTYVKQIATALAQNGFDIHIFAGSPYRTISESIDSYQLHLIKCSDGADFKNKVVSSFEFQHNLCLFNMMESPEIGSSAWDIKKKYTDLPLIVRLHAPNYLVESLKKRYIPLSAKLRYVLGSLRRLKLDLGYWRQYKKENDTDYQFTLLADHITAPSQAMKNWVVKYWELPSSKIKIIPNIFDPASALLNIPVIKSTQFKRIVFFGRLNILKGLVNATKAMKRIMKQYPEWQLRLIGDDGNGPFHGITMKEWICTELQPVLHRVEFIDGLSYELIPEAIAEAEIVLLPSLFESFSYTCVEAMAAGKAVIGSRAGGMADLLQHEQTGLLVDPESENEIYLSLKRLISDNDLRLKLSVAAREQVMSRHYSGLTSGLFFDFYNKILN